MAKKKFSSDRCVLTRGVNEKMKESEEFLRFVQISIGKHFAGDWGEMDEEDKKENEFALRTATARLMSVYIFHKGKEDETKIWIITEWNRSVTTVLFPEEY